MKKNRVLADLHTHLNEKKVKPKDYWAAVKKRKLSIIAITEHSYYKPQEAYQKLKAIQPAGIILIPGMEAKTSAGDLLIYGEDERVYSPVLMKRNVGIEKALKEVKRLGLTASFAHPYGFKLDSVCEVLKEKKAMELIKKYGAGVEYYNGMLASANQLLFDRKIVRKFYGLMDFLDHNRATTKLRLNKPSGWTKKKLESVAVETIHRVREGMIFSQKAEFITTGSDAHYPRSIGSSVIEMKKTPKNEEEFLKMLKKKQILWAGPNLGLKKPIDEVGKKEILEGLFYLTKKRVFKKKKNSITGKIRRKIGLGKRIKTIKRITKRVKLRKIRTKFGRIRKK